MNKEGRKTGKWLTAILHDFLFPIIPNPATTNDGHEKHEESRKGAFRVSLCSSWLIDRAECPSVASP